MLSALLLLGCGTTVAAPSQRVLTFEDRVAAQRAIEQVYWSHRIWPKENPTPKPPLSSVMSDETIRQRVQDYLRKANALQEFWRHPITHGQLQGEIDRMVAGSRDANTLRGLFAALGNDPVLIADALATQTLADRLIRSWYAYDDRFHGKVKRKAESELASCHEVSCMSSMSGNYRETKWRRGDSGVDAQSIGLDAHEWSALRAKWATVPVRTLGGLEENAESFSVSAILALADDEVKTVTIVWPKMSFDTWWRATAPALAATTTPTAAGTFSIPEPRASACVADTWRPTINLPEERFLHTAVWTGSEMIVWGGLNGFYLSNGGRYNPATDSWVPTSTGPGTPVARILHTAIWTGSEMIVWGGQSDNATQLDTGARYNPASDSWVATSPGSSVPSARFNHTAVWTGSEMIVWGGHPGGFGVPLDTGGRYAPSTDSWVPTSTASAPTARELHTAIWTGAEMIVWGGRGPIGGGSFHGVNTGGRYDPVTDTWTPTSTGTDVPDYRALHTAVWTGTEMIVWGGSGFSSELATGGRYDPSTDSWLPTSTAPGVPAARVTHTASWTGGEMIVWGGSGSNASELGTGGRYDPVTNTWRATSQGPNVPSARTHATSVWTGSELIVWGGTSSHGPVALDTGGRYNPSSDSWLPTSRGAEAPIARSLHSAVWTGSEMVVWGGGSGTALLTSGGRYHPATDSWTPTADGASVPEGRVGAPAVWTGKEMIVWGGTGLFDTLLASGGRYNPTTDTWTATTTGNAPEARQNHTVVWTGTDMVVWGGDDYEIVNTGARYRPSSDSWTPTSTGAGVPSPRQHHTAVWTGTEMIVWGGYGDASFDNTGGRYRPSTDTWLPTSTGGDAPAARWGHIAVWTGTEMIVWGGYAGVQELDTGARYGPAADFWIPTPPGSPIGRALHTAVWTGTEMIVWGGVGSSSYPASGGRFSPTMAAWVPTSMGQDVPLGRTNHTVVWTGSEMVVWGGGSGFSGSTGGAYCACPSGAIVYGDADADGYGDPGASMPACDGSIPAGYAANGDDCDDANPASHPGATERCNGIDDSCDGTVDEGGAALCDDGNTCTANDTCSAGACIVGDAPDCNDDNACTGDLCIAAFGCVSGAANLDTSGFSAARVDGRDLVVLAESWNRCPGDPTYHAAADLDRVACVDMTDFHLFMTTFGHVCP